MGEIANLVYGFTAKAKEDGEARFIRITDIAANGTLLEGGAKYVDLSEDAKQKMLHCGDLAVARTGGTYGKTLLYLNEKPAVYASFLIKLDIDESVMLKKYYWYFAKSDLYWDQARLLVSTGGQPQFNANALKKIRIAIPDTEKQRQIVDQLERAESGYNGLLEELMNEISLHEIQLKEFRNKLLSFPQKAA